MTKQEVAQRIKELTTQINHYNRLFFEEHTSAISDYAFDQLLEELRQLEDAFPSLRKKDSPTQRIGESISDDFVQVRHRYPMESLSNTYEKEELLKFIERARKGLDVEQLPFFAELKIDGVALSLIYEDGQFQRAITRGDGWKGDDITRNMVAVEGIPPVLLGKQKGYTEVRGEVYMKKKQFEHLNAYYESIGRARLANPRNGASGLMRNKSIDPYFKQSKPLSFIPYRVLGPQYRAHTQQASMEQLRSWGFQVADTSVFCSDEQAILDYIKKWEEARHDLPFMTDGVVLKVNAFEQQEKMGSTSKSPRWAVAYKYKPESASTKLLGITLQVGRTGVITPVAELAPVHLAGTRVKRATLHNAQEILRLGLHIGDYVHIEKGGDIIPKITAVDKSQSNAEPISYVFALHCPECGSPLEQQEGEANHYCPNQSHCPAQLKGQLKHFVQRKALNITSIGEKMIQLLFQKKLIKYPMDLFDLHMDQLLALEGIQEKSAQNMLQAIEAAKQTPLKQWLFGLGIRYVGATAAKKLVHYFGSMDRLMEASLEELLGIPDIGPKVAESVYVYARDPFFRKQIERFRELGFPFEANAQKNEPVVQDLLGKKIVLSGTFASMQREEVKNHLEARGASVTSSLSKNTSLFLHGDKPSPNKVNKAKSLGIPLLYLPQFHRDSLLDL